MESQNQSEHSETSGSDEKLSALQLYETLQRLIEVSSPNCKNLVSFPLDAILTTNQMAEWFQMLPKEINAKARKGIIPAIPISKTRFRFHPRTIIEHGVAVYARRKK